MAEDIKSLLTQSLLKYQGDFDAAVANEIPPLERNSRKKLDKYGHVWIKLPEQSGVKGSIVDKLITDPEDAGKNLSDGNVDVFPCTEGEWRFYLIKDESSFMALYFPKVRKSIKLFKAISLPMPQKGYAGFPVAIVAGRLPTTFDDRIRPKLEQLAEQVLEKKYTDSEYSIEHELGNKALAYISPKWGVWNSYHQKIDEKKASPSNPKA